jgi:8-oxo-dGTP pyrophosphatase MutT (NUDIX family)
VRSDCATLAPAWLSDLVAAVIADQDAPSDINAWVPVPEDGQARAAAVLIALCDTPDGPGVLLTERAMTLRSHAGQAAFPGGGVDPDDSGPTATALREAVEEVGLDPASVCPLAELHDRYVPGSNHLVTPVIAWWAEPHPVGAVDAGEVARAVVVTMAELADPANRFQVTGPPAARFPVASVRTGNYGPGFEIDELFIWGFTARQLDNLLHLGGWERPWDQASTRPLPPRPLW